MVHSLTKVELSSEFARFLAAEEIVSDDALIASYTTGWSGEFFSTTQLVLKPSTAQQVVEIVQTCNRLGLVMFVQGGNTGLAEGSVPDRPDSVLISLTNMNRIRHVDVASRRMTVDAGVTLAEVQHVASWHGLRYAVDLASRDSATIGGTIATNAGGIRVIADGMTRDNIAGIEAVLASGEFVSHLRGLAKDNTGYSLTHLLAGSEGTLGIITGATLILKELAQDPFTVFFRAPNLAKGIELVHSAAVGNTVLAAEFIDHESLRDTERIYGLRSPVDCAGGIGILLELAHPTDRLQDDAFVALEKRQARDLWNLREHVGMALRQDRRVVGCDVAVRPSDLDELLSQTRTLVAASAPEVLVRTFGHMLDGNVHLLLVSTTDIPHDLAVKVLEIVSALGGSISAEHGVGRIKTDTLAHNRQAGDLAAMRSIKQALDPRGLLNPGVLFPR